MVEGERVDGEGLARLFRNLQGFVNEWFVLLLATMGRYDFKIFLWSWSRATRQARDRIVMKRGGEEGERRRKKRLKITSPEKRGLVGK